jgi:hypothetical protein
MYVNCRLLIYVVELLAGIRSWVSAALVFKHVGIITEMRSLPLSVLPLE